jgi:hypothetical protein
MVGGRFFLELSWRWGVGGKRRLRGDQKVRGGWSDRIGEWKIGRTEGWG